MAGNVDHDTVLRHCQLLTTEDRKLVEPLDQDKSIDTKPLPSTKSIEQTHYIWGRRGAFTMTKSMAIAHKYTFGRVE